MRAAAEIAEAERLSDPQPGDGDAAYELAITDVVTAINQQVSTLSEP